MSIFDDLRARCRDLLSRPGCSVAVTDAEVAVVPERGAPLDYGLRFARLEDEVSFHVLVHLLNFGHGYRHELHRHHGIGAWETMKRGAVRLGPADGARLRALTKDEVGELFFETRTPPADLQPLHRMIFDVLRESGERLERDFHSIVAPLRSAAEVVGTLARTFPAFDDPFLKKAQIAAGELDRWFHYPDKSECTVACDNVLPCVLRAMGAIRLDPDLAARIDRREQLPAGRPEAELRAAAIVAADRIVERAGGAFTARELGDHLWKLGKDPRYRPLERHATKDTVFY